MSPLFGKWKLDTVSMYYGFGLCKAGEPESVNTTTRKDLALCQSISNKHLCKHFKVKCMRVLARVD